MKTRTLLTAVAVALVVTPLMLGGAAFSAEEQNNDAETYRLLNLFGDVFERVRA